MEDSQQKSASMPEDSGPTSAPKVSAPMSTERPKTGQGKCLALRAELDREAWLNDRLRWLEKTCPGQLNKTTAVPGVAAGPVSPAAHARNLATRSAIRAAQKDLQRAAKEPRRKRPSLDWLNEPQDEPPPPMNLSDAQLPPEKPAVNGWKVVRSVETNLLKRLSMASSVLVASTTPPSQALHRLGSKIGDLNMRISFNSPVLRMSGESAGSHSSRRVHPIQEVE